MTKESDPKELASKRLIDAKDSCSLASSVVVPSVTDLFALALKHHQSGLLEEAQTIYKQILAIDDKYIIAIRNLGIIYMQRGDLEEGNRLIKRALELYPEQPAALYIQGNLLQGLKRIKQALTSYDRAISLRPNYAEAFVSRGIALQCLNRLGEALASYERAIALRPNYAEAHSNRGNALQALERTEEALASYDRAIALRPNYPEAYNNRGNVYKDLNRLEEALASYDRAIALRSGYAEAYSNRGIALQAMGHAEEALASYDKAIALQPNYPEAYNNRGNVLKEFKRLEEALVSYDRAIALRPNYAEAYGNRGIVLQALERMDEALVSYDRAIAIKPDYAEAHSYRGIVLQGLERADEALTSFEKALAIKSDMPPYILGSWLDTKMQTCNWENLYPAFRKVVKAVDVGERVISPFYFLSIPCSMEKQRRCASLFIHDKYPARYLWDWQGAHYKHKRIRVGYFSADFRDHPVSHLISRLIELHDRTRFEIYAFSFGAPSKDLWRQRLEKAFDAFIDVRSKSDEEIVALSRKMEVDIAVDLTGHTQNARTGVFAMRSAPVQVNYLGYPGTLGADYIDYIISDSIVSPPGHKQYYVEKIAYLPWSFQVNDSTKLISDQVFNRTELSLPVGAFVFCCFNNYYKITPDLYDIWMRLLREVDGSVLWLAAGNHTAISNLRVEAARRGVSPDRLIFATRMKSLADHFARHLHADLFLDTFYYNAHTTASDALWSGVPVLTCLGNTYAGRVAASLLHALGLPELVTYSHEEYASLALDLATDPERLASIRRKLVANRATHPLFDTARFTCSIEDAYRMMHSRQQAGLRPDHIFVNE